jgi:hypothetical protein
MYFDTNLKKRQTEKQLKRRGLTKPEIDLEKIGIIELVTAHGFDTDLYVAVDTGVVEIRDGRAYVVYEKKNRASDLAAGFDVCRKMKDKVNVKRDEIFVSGFNFTVEGKTHSLQTRGADDLLNWVALLGTARVLPVETLVDVRTKANTILQMKAGEVVTMLSAGMAYRQAVLDASWALKDDIDKAVTDEDAFVIYEGGSDTVWPDDSPIVV